MLESIIFWSSTFHNSFISDFWKDTIFKATSYRLRQQQILIKSSVHKNQSQNTKELSEASAIKVHRKQHWLNLHSCRKQQFARLSFFWRCWKFSSFLSHQETHSSSLKKSSKCFANSGSKSVSDADCNIYWPTRNWSKAQRRKDTEVMRKQDDVKSQTSGPFALTLQGI